MKTVTDLLNYYRQFPGDTLLIDLPIVEEETHHEESEEPDHSKSAPQ